MTSINTILTNLAAFIIAIGVLVTVHEYGHFIVGKLFNVKVLKFSIGFGRSIYSYQSKIGDKTEFRLSLIPLGGYVQFLDGRNGEIEPKEDGRAFNQQSLLVKIAILFAGPMFNFIFAILAYFIVFSNGIPTMKPIIGEVVENSYAYSAGIKYGDEIISIDDKNTKEVIPEDFELNFHRWRMMKQNRYARNIGFERIGFEREGVEGEMYKRKFDVWKFAMGSRGWSVSNKTDLL